MNKFLSIPEIFELNADTYGKLIAIDHEKQGTISYEDLDLQANRLANLLKPTDNVSRVITGVCLAAGIKQIMGMMAVFKAGHVYLPMDLGAPFSRVNQILDDNILSQVLISENQVDHFIELNKSLKRPVQRLIVLNDQGGLKLLENDSVDFTQINCEDLKASSPKVIIDPEDTAYIYYTSGSTGRAKGIKGKHASLSHYIQWHAKEFGFDRNTNVSQIAPVTFDASLKDILCGLCSGATVCMPSEETKDNLTRLKTWIRDKKITTLQCVPSLFRLMTREISSEQTNNPFPNLKKVLLAGETLFKEDIRKWRSVAGDDIEIVNLYGTTESTILKTFYRVEEYEGAGVVPIGQSIPGSLVVLINEERICKVGEIGEVYIKSPYLTKGYIDKELNKSVFVQNPLVKQKEDIIYKTGDLGRFLKSGDIEILGRSDHQTKVNGVRIELEEIEAHVLSTPWVSEAVISAFRDSENQNNLVCYYGGENRDSREIIEVLKGSLSASMIPAYFIHMEEFPRTMSGKIDRKSLPKPVGDIVANENFMAPEGEIEEALTDIFKDVLSVKKVSRDSSFFTLGGTSLKAILLISRVFKTFDVQLKIGDIFDNPSVQELGNIVQQNTKSTYSTIEPVEEQDHYQVSYAQRRLWVLNEFENARTAYLITRAYELKGSLSLDALQVALNHVISYHESLKTVFVTVGEETRQKVGRFNSKDYQIDFQDVSSKKNRSGIIEDFIKSASDMFFDLSKGPLFKVQVLKTDNEQFLFLLTMHHIITDGWSMNIMFKDLIDRYNRSLSGNLSKEGTAKLQYRDFAIWHNQLLETEDDQGSRKYWMDRFSGEIPVMEMPLSFDRPIERSYKGALEIHMFDQSLSNEILSLSTGRQASFLALLLTALKVLVHRYSGASDITIGTNTAGRTHADSEDQIGFFVNTLALRTSVESTDTFGQLLAKVNETTLDAFDHQTCPFDLLVDDLKLPHDLNRHPLFDIMIILHELEHEKEEYFQMADLEISSHEIQTTKSKFDLTFNFKETKDGLVLGVEYDTSLFDRSYIKRLIENYEHILGLMSEEIDAPISSTEIISSKQIETTIKDFNVTKRNLQTSTVLEQFQTVVRNNPNLVAVKEGGRELTYKQLDDHSTKLAIYFSKLAPLGTGKVVAISLEPSIDAISSILGVLKCGSAFLPIAHDNPIARTAKILTDARPAFFITNIPNDYSKLGCAVYDIPPFDSLPTGKPEDIPSLHETDPAYVLYTSGSTGEPKGVLVSHRNLNNYISWANEYYFDNKNDFPFALFTPLTFDLTLTSVFSTLCRGDKLVVLPRELTIDQRLVYQFQPKSGIKAVKLTPSHVQILDTLDLAHSEVEVAILGGEALSQQEVNTLFRLNPNMKVYNEYGPTETTIGSTISSAFPNEKPDIGKPIANTMVFVLDEDGNPQPVDVWGELHIAGDGLAIGYLNDPELTDKKYAVSKFSEHRIYATGDLARWRENGSLELEGRIDQQVKVRGFRIEPQEIRQVLLEMPEVEQAAIIAEDDQLIAYLVTSSSFATVDDVRTHLERILPMHMVPSHFKCLDHLPINANGKLDVEALKKRGRVTAKAVERPDGPVELKLTQLFGQILDLEIVDSTYSFFHLGGNSIRAIMLMSRINRDLQVSLNLNDIFRHASIKSLAKLINEKNKTEALEISLVEEQQHYILSHAQKRLWVLNQFELAKAAYNMVESFHLKGQLSVSTLQSAFEELLGRHESLRTRFITVDGIPRQVIVPSEQLGFSLDVEDMRGPGPPALAQKVEDAQRTVFDLETAPLLRARLYQTDDEEYMFVFVLHHIITDGWSMGVIFNDLIECYNSISEGREVSLKPLSIHYKDYSAWRQECSTRDHEQESQAYWQEKFSGELPTLDLPLTYARSAERSYAGQRYSHVMSRSLLNNLRQVGNDRHASFFMVVLSAVKGLMYRYTQQSDLVLGTNTTGRQHHDLEDQIGFFINTLALRTHLSPSDSFLEVLEKVKATTLEAFDHQDYPFDQLVDDLHLQRDLSRHPLFDVMVILHELEYESKGLPEMRELEVTPQDYENPASKFDLTFNFKPIAAGLKVDIEFDTSLFSERFIKQVVRHLEMLMLQVVDHPDIGISTVRLMEEAEEQELMERSRGDFSAGTSEPFISRFEQVASSHPDDIALVEGPRTLSYGSLNKQAGQLAAYLANQAALGPGKVVAIHLPPSVDAIVSMLAVLKTGSAFLPIDPDSPPIRSQAILDDAQPSLFIVSGTQPEAVMGGAVINLDELKLPTKKASFSSHASDPKDPVYLLYTSGSTGRPKGVLVAQEGLANYLSWANDFYFANGSGHHFALFTPLTFDLTLTSIFTTLLRADQLFILPNGDASEALEAQFNTESPVNAVKLTPSHVKILESLPLDRTNINTAILGGERLHQQGVQLLKRLNPGMKVFNEYGPTETTIGCTVAELEAGQEVHIGSPIANIQALVLDASGMLMPTGVWGELSMAGKGLALGYLNDPQLTEEKYPGSALIGDRIYRSGDLARWSEAGYLELKGRTDAQVKLRGYRIEPEEIRHQLLLHPDVLQAAVVVTNQQLLAYVHAGPMADDKGLRAFLAERLPAYMLPQVYIPVEKIPLTKNGKLDIKGLPVSADSIGKEEVVFPSTEVEEKLLSIWKQILHAETLGVTDNFFERGGHSLNAVQVVTIAAHTFQVALNIRDIFNHPTVESLGAWIEQQAFHHHESVQAVEEQDTYPVSNAQRRLWILDQVPQARYTMYLPHLYTFEGLLDEAAFVDAFQFLVKKHESLRTRIVDTDQQLRQQVVPFEAWDFDVPVLDWSDRPDAEESVHSFALDQVQEPFDLKKGPLMKALLIKGSEEKHYFILSMHHIISDEWSMQLMVMEIARVYNQTVQGHPVTVDPLKVQYRDVALWQSDYLASEKGVRDKEFWLREFDAPAPSLQLLTDFHRPENQTYKGDIINYELPDDIVRAIHEISGEYQVTPFIFLLAATNILLYRYTGQNDITIGTPIAGRSHADLENQIGMYINTLALRNHVGGDAAVSQFIQLVKDNTLNAYQHQDYPFDQLLEDLNPEQDKGRAALFDVTLIYQNIDILSGKDHTEIQGVKADHHDIPLHISKNDLRFQFNESEKSISLSVEYNSDLFLPERIQRMAQHLFNLVEDMKKNGGKGLNELSYLTEMEKEESERIKEESITFSTSKSNMKVHTLFREMVSKYGDEVAIEEENRTISYTELNVLSNRMADLLIDGLNVGPNSSIGVCMPSGLESIATMLAIFKSGSVFLPLNSKFSYKQIQQISDQTSLNIVVIRAADESSIKEVFEEWDFSPRYLVIIGDDFHIGLYKLSRGEYNPTPIDSNDLSKGDPDVVEFSDSSAYIYFTSGSTGNAKGILGKHESLAHYITWHIQEFSFGPSSRISQIAPFTFDASLKDILGALCSGGRLCVPSEKTRENVGLLIDWLEASGITALQCVPSLFRVLSKELRAKNSTTAFPEMRYLLLAGEVLFNKDVSMWRSLVGEHVQLINLYGTTETTILKSYHYINKIGDNLSSVVPVGKPIPDSEILIIREGHLCDEGELGEVYIQTPYLTKGYLDTRMNNGVFVQHPLITEREELVYKTGDTGRYTSDRIVEVLGRQDNQVKINGIRIELSEIEGALKGLAEIDEVVVVAHRDQDNLSRLICYYTGRNRNGREIRDLLKDSLNETFMPGFFVHMEEFPRTISGKVDRKALPQPEEISSQESGYEPPVGSVEVKVASHICSILNKPKIGRNTSFFDLGGTSLKAILLISRIHKEFGVSISAGDVFENQTVKELAGLISLASPSSEFVELPYIEEQQHYVLSHAQKRLWVLDQFEASKTAYNLIGAHHLKGQLSVSTLQSAFEELLGRHESLRTRFITVDGIPRQVIVPSEQLGFSLDVEDMRGPGPPALAQKVEDAQRTVFDLETAPLLRARLYQTDDEEYMFVFVLHHIITDGWSMGVIFNDLIECYNSISEGREVSLKPLSIHYKDYSAWRQECSTRDHEQESQAYWQEKFSGELPTLDLPLTYARSAERSYAGQRYSHVMSRSLLNNLRQVGNDRHASFFMVVLSAVKGLMYRYTQQSDLVLGTNTTGRQHHDLEDQIGFFINTLALRTHLSPSDSFLEVLEKVKATTLEAFDHQDYPFDQLVDDLHLQRDLSRHPLFDVMVILHELEYESKGLPEMRELEVTPQDYENPASKFDLTFNFKPIAAGLKVDIEFDTSLFSERFIKQVVRHLEMLMLQVVDHPDIGISTVRLMEEAEEQELMERSRGDFSAGTSEPFISRFEQVASSHPDDIALVEGPRTLSYGSLNKQAGQLAAYLANQAALGPGKVVAIHLPPSVDAIVSMLAVLKTGSAFLPIDPDSPPIRSQAILDDAQPSLFIVSGTQPEAVMGGAVINLDELKLPTKKASFSSHASDPKDPVYLLYTSGSTGRPKGVLVAQEGLANYLSWANDFYFANGSGHHFALFTPLTFDLTLTSIFTTLLRADQLFILPNGDASEALEAQFNTESPVNAVKLTPSHVKILESLPLDRTNINTAILGGERLHQQGVQLLKRLNPGMKVFNEYGPTETTIGCTVAELEAGQEVHIGSPIANIQALVLDASGMLMPTGVWGELSMAGKGLALGYLNDPQLTEEKYPGSALIGDRIYRSGDLARWSEAGYLELKGRTDAQVKLRGYRIEPEEIRHQLLLHPDVLQAAVVVTNQQLLAYVHAGPMADDKGLRAFLAERLPAYMLPQVYIPVEKIPLTKNGKLDIKGLPVSADSIGKEEVVFPSTEVEEKLLSIWKQILHAETLGVTDNFFERGGHSLNAVQVVTIAAHTFQVALNIRDIFNHPTVESLGAWIEQQAFHHHESVQAVEEQDTYPVSNAQRRLWILDQVPQARYTMYLPHLYTFEGLLDEAAFVDAFQFLVKKHESLRTRIVDTDQQLRQQVVPFEAWDFDVPVLDWSDRPDAEESVHSFALDQVQEPFDLKKGPLMKALLIKGSEEKHYFILSMHHIISDEWSMQLMVMEIARVYNQTVQGHPVTVDPLKVQYRDVALWQSDYLASEKGVRDKEFWLREFDAPAPSLQLLTDFHRPENQTYKGDIINYELPDDIVRAIHEISGEYQVTPFIFLLAATNILLYRYTGQNDITIGTPIAGRSHADLENQIGMYINTLALRNHVGGDAAVSQFIQLVKDNTLNAYQHQDYPFDQLLEDLNPEQDKGRAALFDVTLIYQNIDILSGKDHTEIQGVKADHHDIPLHISKNDLRFQFNESEKSISLSVEYNSDLFLPERIQRMAQHLFNLVEDMKKNSNKPIKDMEYLSSSEKASKQVHHTEQGTYDSDFVHVMFENRAMAVPDQIAIEQGKIGISYRELNVRSNQIAHFLLETSDFAEEQPVIVFMPPGIEIVATMIAVFKTGGIYIPMDVKSSSLWIDEVFDRCHSSLVMTTPELENELKAILEGKGFDYQSLIILEKDKVTASDSSSSHLFSLSGPASDSPTVLLGEEDSAYIYFTSGSTGKPKGIIGKHNSLAHYIHWHITEFEFNVNDKVSQLAAVTFDASLKDILGALCSGATLVIPDTEVIANSTRLVDWLADYRISTLHCVPSLLRLMVKELKSRVTTSKLSNLRQVLLAGELLYAKDVQNWHEYAGEHVKMVNLYGTTEATILKTYHQIDTVPGNKNTVIPVGKSIPDASIILVNDGHACEPGEIGDVYIQSPHLTKGYLDSSLNNKVFVQHPLEKRKKIKVYKTGDLGRFTDDGVLVVLGRNDSQVKINGVRVELSDVESAALSIPEIEEVVVISYRDQDNLSRLICYYTGTKTEGSRLRSSLSGLLNQSVIPGFFIYMEEFPRTITGKIDRKPLPTPETIAQQESGYELPHGRVEEKIAEVVASTLNKSKVGRNTSFFDLGGTSLRAILLISRIHKEFGVSINIGDVFENQTVRELAELISSEGHSGLHEVPYLEEQEHYALSHAQQRLWVLDQFEGTKTAYNMIGAYQLKGTLAVKALKQALDILLKRHESIRTIFITVNGVPRQKICLSESFDLSLFDFRDENDPEGKARIQLASAIETPFNLAEGPLIQAELYQIRDDQYIFFMNLHHIIADGWSIQILFKELLLVYNSLLESAEPKLPKIDVHYKEFTAWHTDLLASESVKPLRDYWHDVFSEPVTPMQLPGTFTRPSVKTFDGDTVSIIIDKVISDRLVEITKKKQVSLLMVFMATVKTLLYKYTGQTDIIVGTNSLGRYLEKFQQQIGLFVSTIPVRTAVDPKEGFQGLLQNIKKGLLGAIDHEQYPFDALVDELNLDRDLSRHPIFDIMVIHHDFGGNNAVTDTLSNLEVSKYDPEDRVSKYDLTFNFKSLPEGISLEVSYNTNLFYKEWIDRLLEHYQMILQSIIEDESQPLERVSFMSSGEQKSV